MHPARSSPSGGHDLREVATRKSQVRGRGAQVGGRAQGGGRTFHGHTGRGVDAALCVAHAAQVAARVLLAHALYAQLLVGVCQVDSCSGWGVALSSEGSEALTWRASAPRPSSGSTVLPDSSSSSLSSLYHKILGTCAPATGHRISRESLTFTRRSVKFCVSRGASRAGGGGRERVKWSCRKQESMPGRGRPGLRAKSGAGLRQALEGSGLSTGLGGGWRWASTAWAGRRTLPQQVQAPRVAAQAPSGRGERLLGKRRQPSPAALPASPCTDRYFLWQCLSWLRRSCTSHT